MTIKEVSINSYESEEEQREKKEFEIYFNGWLRQKFKDADKEYRMEGFTKKFIESHEDILIFDEHPKVVKRYHKGTYGYKMNKGEWLLATTAAAYANLAWEVWQARARLGVQMESEQTQAQESVVAIRAPERLV